MPFMRQLVEVSTVNQSSHCPHLLPLQPMQKRTTTAAEPHTREEIEMVSRGRQLQQLIAECHAQQQLGTIPDQSQYTSAFPACALLASLSWFFLRCLRSSLLSGTISLSI
ncbi:hypothetical protein BDV12DRAFT_162400 [Aspergillus spectabilis]